MKNQSSTWAELVTLPAGSPEHDEFMWSLAEELAQLMWTAGADGGIDYVNRSWTEFTGVALDAAQEQGLWGVVHPEDRERVEAVWARSIASGEPFTAGFRVLRAEDDTYRWFSARASAIRDPDGVIVRWLGTAIDVDDHKRSADVQEFLATAGEQLAGSLEREGTLARLARLAVPKLADWCAVDLLDADAKLHRVTVTHQDRQKESLVMELVERYPPNPDDPNDGLYRVVHGGRSELVPDIPDSLLELAARDAEHLRIVRALGLRSYMAVPLVARGRVLGVLSLIYAESGRRYTSRDLGLAEDLARRAALAIDNAALFHELQQSANELEIRVRERTAELVAVNRELESFCYSVSHDLRAPLRHINGFAQLLSKRAESTLDEQSREYIQTISNAATHGAKLVDNLLEFSRLGRSELVKLPIDLADLIACVVRDLASEAAGRSVDWHIGELPVVSADPTLLRIALTNLLDNALKYTRPKPDARIEITAYPRPEEIELCIRDNGVGFDAKYIDKLFGVFQRLHTTEQFEGTGIGLANVRRIISRHGGRTWATGAVGSGAAFFLTLPFESSKDQS